MPRKKASHKPEVAEVEPALAPESDEAPRSRSLWSGTISFGLVTVPVELYGASKRTRSSLRMLSPEGTPLVRRYYGDDGKPVTSEDLERGYQLDDGSFVVVTDEELEALLPEQSRDIDLTRFVDRDAIPPLYFERAYFLVPTSGSNVAYRLLASTMERTRKAGIATFVMRGKQYLVAIFANDGILRAETMRFSDELRTPETVGLPAVKKPKPQDVKRLRSEIAELATDTFAHDELKDAYWRRLEELVEQKLAQEQDLVTPAVDTESEEPGAEVIDLVAVLRRSLAAQAPAAEKKAAKAAGPTRTHAKKSTKAAHPAKKRATKTAHGGAKPKPIKATRHRPQAETARHSPRRRSA